MSRVRSRLRLPSGPELYVLGAAALVWAGTAGGRALGWAAVTAALLIGGVGLAILRRSASVVLAASLVAGTVSGALSIAHEEQVLGATAPSGPVRIVGRALDDARPGRDGDWFLLEPTRLQQGGEWLEWAGPPLRIGLEGRGEVVAQQLVRVDGVARAAPGLARGRPFAGRVEARQVTVLGPAGHPLFVAGNAVRGRVAVGLARYGEDPAAALVSGFLIGDVRLLPLLEAERLRAAGLSHFVAVSGSNVAVFLGLWWVIAGPLAMGTRRRAVAGLAGLALFVVITRWEPSVLRAATMAGLVLSGRAVGLALTPWSALGSGVAGLLLVAGELAGNAGFQLSVAATAGVIAGAGVVGPGRARWVAGAAAVTLSAQVAVAPLLLWHFGSVPLVAPLANVLAAPLVLASTISGGLGVLTGLTPLLDLGVAAARLVLLIARWAAPWPQLELGGMAVLVLLAALSVWKPARPSLAVVAALGLAATAVLPGTRLSSGLVAFDVGQGDALLLRGGGGETVLIDGGPDPVLLLRKLRGYGIDRVDLLVVSHPHADHLSGVLAALESVPVTRLWHPGFPEAGPLMEGLLVLAAQRGVEVDVPRAGWKARVGEIRLDVLGPLRRYGSPNDHSLVLLATMYERTVLLPGDIEVIAQRELGTVRADVLKVPHQGAATSDLDWLRAVEADMAIVSVGPNPFGHPSAEVLAALEAAGAEIRRTDVEGDVIIPLDP